MATTDGSFTDFLGGAVTGDGVGGDGAGSGVLNVGGAAVTDSDSLIDYLKGTFGDDVTVSPKGFVTLDDSGTGTHYVVAGEGTAKVNGGKGVSDDVIIGSSDDNKINAGAGNDVVFGLDGSDTIGGGAGDDLILGGAGNDKLDGGAGIDEIYGGTGNDTIKGGAGNDKVSGEAGNDKLDGGSGNDNVSGGTGRDTIAGGSGDDTISGGAGSDKMTGGSGADTFVFASGESDSNASSHDVITDFKAGDTITIAADDTLTILNDGIEKVGKDVVVHFSDGSDVTLKGAARDFDNNKIVLDDDHNISHL